MSNTRRTLEIARIAVRGCLEFVSSALLNACSFFAPESGPVQRKSECRIRANTGQSASSINSSARSRNDSDISRLTLSRWLNENSTPPSAPKFRGVSFPGYTKLKILEVR
jgi:hypothetical protein